MIDREALKVACEAAYMSAPRNKPYRLVSAIARQNIERATEAAITAYLTHAGEGAVPVGEAGSMPGTDGFTMAAFEAKDVPIGTKLYAAPHPPRQDGAREAFKAGFTLAYGCQVESWSEAFERWQALTTPPAPDEAVEAEREACALLVEPTGPRPCDCYRCDCGNASDAEAVARWDAETLAAKAIRARSRRDVGGGV